MSDRTAAGSIREQNLIVFLDEIRDVRGIVFTPMSDSEIRLMVSGWARQERAIGKAHLRATVNRTRRELGMPTVEREQLDRALAAAAVAAGSVGSAFARFAAGLDALAKGFRRAREAEAAKARQAAEEAR